MRATYSNIKSAGTVCGVEYATATAHLDDGRTSMPVSDRMSKFKLFEYIGKLQEKYGIKETDIDGLLILIKEDAQQAKDESLIE